jgi:hypothetical protein
MSFASVCPKFVLFSTNRPPPELILHSTINHQAPITISVSPSPLTFSHQITYLYCMSLHHCASCHKIPPTISGWAIGFAGGRHQVSGLKKFEA